MNRVKLSDIMTGLFVFVCVVLMGVIIYFSVGVEHWQRIAKSFKSANEGLNRVVVVYSATGEELCRYEGTFDVDYSNGRVLFDDDNGKRHVIYFTNGTVVVDEV